MGANGVDTRFPDETIELSRNFEGKKRVGEFYPPTQAKLVACEDLLTGKGIKYYVERIS